ncbi:SNF2 family N-terminal domain-containing protein [Xylariomycetidae sp. FL0641]|nr:SNF2 family N-terminal domain-containing protein [Xylariomycetidae sp. FL0641]
MARTKGFRAARYSKAQARRKSYMLFEESPSIDPFPQDLLQFLQTLASATEEPTDPSPKRPRIDRPEPIVVARESFAISRPTRRDAEFTSDSQTTSFPDVGKHLNVGYDDDQHSLLVSSRPRSPHSMFKADLYLRKPKLTPAVQLILDLSGSTQEDKEEEGTIWVCMDLDLERGNDQDRLCFSLVLNWNPAVTALRTKSQRKTSQRVLDTFFGSSDHASGDSDRRLLPQTFYEAAFMPDRDAPSLMSAAVPGLRTTLFPFQQRAVRWLLSREDAQFDPNDPNKMVQTRSPPSEALPLSWTMAKDADGRPIYLSNLYHVLSRDIAPYRAAEESLRGGILAEEMGLGKTVEVISLILAHKRPDGPPRVLDKYTNSHVRPTNATLIVTPNALMDQWLIELKRHAPDLRVTSYTGMRVARSTRARMSLEDEIVTQFVTHDVVVTTYNVLQREIHYAMDPPDRSMRHSRQYELPRSPLVQFSWWRVCLDEAQQIDSGASYAATVARLIPRVNAWGISGTPVKSDIRDLWGLLLFLHYEPFASSLAVWEDLLTMHRDLFKPLFNRLALRHSKRAVRDELTLPAQNRFVVTMPFTAIEEQNYQDQFRTLAQSMGLDEHGSPLSGTWNPHDPSVLFSMRRALSSLRQTVLHPELGPGRLTLAQRNRALHSIEEVLDAMIEQSDAMIRNDQRTWLVNKLKRGQLLETCMRIKNAVALWQEVLKEAEPILANCREQLQIELEKASQAAAEKRSQDAGSHGSEEELDTPEDEAETAKVGECRRKLRSALDIKHRAVFLIASAYYQMKTDEDEVQEGSEEFKRLELMEVEGYDLAKQLRKEILQEPQMKAASLMKKIGNRAGNQSFVEIPEIEPLSMRGLGGMTVLKKLEELQLALNDQANQLDEWRESVIQLLLRPLVDEEDYKEITGDEYEDSTKIQDDLMAFTLVLRAAIGDRQDAIAGTVNERVRYEVKYAKRRANDGDGHAPEKTLAMLEEREKVKPPEGLSFRGIISELRELNTRLRHETQDGSDRARIEHEIIQRQYVHANRQFLEQTKVVKELDRELQRFTMAMNARVEFYRQLQAVSDTVMPFELGERQDPAAISITLRTEEESAHRRMTSSEAKHRYLLHLKETGQGSNEPKYCVICQTDFMLGVLTICGHHFCKECMTMWWKAHQNCPICKKHLSLAMMNDITLKKQELRLRQGQEQALKRPDTAGNRKATGIYSTFSEAKLEAVQNIKLDGPSYATKINTIIRTLLWLREEDPGAKSIVFSQFGGFLKTLADAFARYGIGYVTFDSNPKGVSRYKEDPAIECLLMDARAHSSGLNLVNANHVLLCEPLLNTALELQAIARVDRIGQEHETTVWLYLVEGTVEESIYNLSVQRRLEHMSETGKGKSKAAAEDISTLELEAANSMELQSASLAKLMNKDKELGEVVENSDLWECLFGHLSKDKAVPASSDDRFNNPAVRGFLAAEAAEQRQRDADESGSAAEAGPST